MTQFSSHSSKLRGQIFFFLFFDVIVVCYPTVSSTKNDNVDFLNTIIGTLVERRIIVVTIIIALFSASEKALCVLVICDSEWPTVSLHSAFSISTEVVYLQRSLVVTWLVTRKTAAVWAHELCTPYNQAQVYTLQELRGMLGIKTTSGY